MIRRNHPTKKCIECGTIFRYKLFRNRVPLDRCEKCQKKIRYHIAYNKNPEYFRLLAKKDKIKYSDYYENYFKEYYKRDYVKAKKRAYNRSPKGKEIAKKSKLKYRYQNGGTEIDKLWRKNNPDRVRRHRIKSKHSEKGHLWAINYQHRRKSWMGKGKVTREEWEELKSKYKNKCADCGKGIKLEMDHVFPLSKGGVHHISNIQPRCRECNAKKSNKIIWPLINGQKNYE